MNSDGIPDVIVAEFTQQLDLQAAVYLGNGNGTFQASQLLKMSTPPNGELGLEVGDIDADGLLDLIFQKNLGYESLRGDRHKNKNLFEKGKDMSKRNGFLGSGCIILAAVLHLTLLAQVQTEGNNAVFANTTSVVGSTAYIDASPFYVSPGNGDICQTLYYILKNVAPAQGAVVDARGIILESGQSEPPRLQKPATPGTPASNRPRTSRTEETERKD